MELRLRVRALAIGVLQRYNSGGFQGGTRPVTGPPLIFLKEFEMTTIIDVFAREVLDSRGFPTVEVEVELE